jgi:hypothetical protein
MAVKSAAEAAGGRPARIPPSIARSWPVTNDEASLASYSAAAATSGVGAGLLPTVEAEGHR